MLGIKNKNDEIQSSFNAHVSFLQIQTKHMMIFFSLFFSLNQINKQQMTHLYLQYVVRMTQVL